MPKYLTDMPVLSSKCQSSGLGAELMLRNTVGEYAYLSGRPHIMSALGRHFFYF